MDSAELARVHQRIDKLDDKLCGKIDALGKNVDRVINVCPICQAIVFGTSAKPGVKDTLAEHDKRLEMLEEKKRRASTPVLGFRRHLHKLYFTLAGGVVWAAGEWLWGPLRELIHRIRS